MPKNPMTMFSHSSGLLLRHLFAVLVIFDLLWPKFLTETRENRKGLFGLLVSDPIS